jgi:hypothetical protein
MCKKQEIKVYVTEVEKDGKLFAGRRVVAKNWQEAAFLAYPEKVIGVFITEIEISEN